MRPQGGFFLWLHLRPGIHSRDVQKRRPNAESSSASGPQFFADGKLDEPRPAGLQLRAMEDIEEGIHRLGEAMSEVASAVGVK